MEDANCFFLHGSHAAIIMEYLAARIGMNDFFTWRLQEKTHTPFPLESSIVQAVFRRRSFRDCRKFTNSIIFFHASPYSDNGIVCYFFA